MKVQDLITSRQWVAHVDDERALGNSIIVTLHEPWCFVNDETCGVQGFDTLRDAEEGTRKSAVYLGNN